MEVAAEDAEEVAAEAVAEDAEVVAAEVVAAEVVAADVAVESVWLCFSAQLSSSPKFLI